MRKLRTHTLGRIYWKRLIASIILGGVVTILVAWWFALQPRALVPFPDNWRLSQSAEAGQFETVPIRGEPVTLVVYETPGVRRIWKHRVGVPRAENLELRLRGYKPGKLPRWSQAAERLETSRSVREYAFGWPLPALRYFMITSDEISGNTLHAKGLPFWLLDRLGSSLLLLPLDVLVLPMVVNTGFFALLFYSLVTIPSMLRSLRRRLTKRCLSCGYSLEDLTTDTCPECGTGIKPKRSTLPE